MKTLRPAKAEESALTTGAPIITLGYLPAKLATVTSEILARLLNGERMTGLETVYDASTTRLAAVIHYLESAYGWTVERKVKAVGCKDGRVSLVSEYWINPAVIHLAMAEGAAAWCADVRSARRHLRVKAAETHRLAARAKAARKNRSHLGQHGLLGEEMDGCHGPL
jgi:hypothetical protein